MRPGGKRPTVDLLSADPQPSSSLGGQWRKRFTVAPAQLRGAATRGHQSAFTTKIDVSQKVSSILQIFRGVILVSKNTINVTPLQEGTLGVHRPQISS